MSNTAYSRQELKSEILRLGIIDLSVPSIHLRKKRITSELYNHITKSTSSCRDNISERIYWIFNDIEDYPICQTCGVKFKPKCFYGFKEGYKNVECCSASCSRLSEQHKIRNLKKYGTTVFQQFTTIKEKRKKTCLVRYGVEHSLQVPEFREKGEITCLERYGERKPNIYGSKSFSNLMIKKFGVENAFQAQLVKDKIEETNFQKYGVRNCMQNSEIFELNSHSRHSYKHHTLPSGKEILYQGYELVAIIELLKTFSENEIFNNRRDIPTITYDKSRKYFPDIYIPSNNLIIEVKSTWTYNQKLDNNLLKSQATRDAGYNFQFWICSASEVLYII